MLLKRLEVLRQALHQWLRRRSFSRFEEEWIAALRDRPGFARDAEDWLDAQAWSQR